MAIKKNYKTGTKYNYAVINQLVYNKESSILVNVLLHEKDRVWKPKVINEVPTGETDKKVNPSFPFLILPKRTNPVCLNPMDIDIPKHAIIMLEIQPIPGKPGE